MLQKLLGVCFFSTILVLSYVATLHIVTNRVDALHHKMTATERSKTLRMSGPVPLRPISNHVPAGEKKYTVHRISKPVKVSKESMSIQSKKSKKKLERRPASFKKKKSKKRH